MSKACTSVAKQHEECIQGNRREEGESMQPEVGHPVEYLEQIETEWHED